MPVMALTVILVAVGVMGVALAFCGLLELCRRMDDDRERKHWMEED